MIAGCFFCHSELLYVFVHVPLRRGLQIFHLGLQMAFMNNQVHEMSSYIFLLKETGFRMQTLECSLVYVGKCFFCKQFVHTSWRTVLLLVVRNSEQLQNCFFHSCLSAFVRLLQSGILLPQTSKIPSYKSGKFFGMEKTSIHIQPAFLWYTGI